MMKTEDAPEGELHHRGERYGAVPAELLHDGKMSPGARLVVAELYLYLGPKTNTAWPGQKRLAADLGRTPRTVRAWLLEARSAGWIEVGKLPGTNRNTYTVGIPERVRKKSAGPPDVGVGAAGNFRSVRRVSSGQSGGKLPVLKDHQSKDHPNNQSRPDGRNGPPKKVADALRRRLADYFCELTGLPPPEAVTEAEKRRAGQLWWAPIREVCRLADWREHAAAGLMHEAVSRLQERELTISDPNSIIKTCRAIVGEIKSGHFRPRARSPGGPSWLDRLREKGADDV